MVPIVLALVAAGCVSTNTETGQPIPRGDQKFPFEQVEKAAEKLKVGMSKYDVLLQLGSPAEKDEANGLWVYLPERYGILIPARALRLEFKDNVLQDFGYRPIVLGARL